MSVVLRFAYDPNEPPPDPAFTSKVAYKIWEDSKADYLARQRSEASWAGEIAKSDQERADYERGDRPTLTLNAASEAYLAMHRREEAAAQAKYKAEAGRYRRYVIEETDPRHRELLLTEFAKRAGLCTEYLTPSARQKAEYYIVSAEGAALFVPDQPVKRHTIREPEPEMVTFPCHRCRLPFRTQEELQKHLQTTRPCPKKCGTCSEYGEIHNCYVYGGKVEEDR